MSKPGTPKTPAAESNYEQEAKLEKLFRELGAGFKKLDSSADATKQASQLKELTNKMQEAKT